MGEGDFEELAKMSEVETGVASKEKSPKSARAAPKCKACGRLCKYILVFTLKYDLCMLKCVFQGSSWKDRSGKVHLESCGGFQKWLDSQSGAGGSSVARTEIGGEEECGGCIDRGHQDRGNQ